MNSRHFYQDETLATLVETHKRISLMQVNGHRLAVASDEGVAVRASDVKHSLVSYLQAGLANHLCYTSYGYSKRVPGNSFVSLYNGEWLDTWAGSYPLGNGIRFYNTALMRFMSADTLSPFGIGGMNSYAFCQDNPINYADPSGRFRINFFSNTRLQARPKERSRFSFFTKTFTQIKGLRRSGGIRSKQVSEAQREVNTLVNAMTADLLKADRMTWRDEKFDGLVRDMMVEPFIMQSYNASPALQLHALEKQRLFIDKYLEFGPDAELEPLMKDVREVMRLVRLPKESQR